MIGPAVIVQKRKVRLIDRSCISSINLAHNSVTIKMKFMVHVKNEIIKNKYFRLSQTRFVDC